MARADEQASDDVISPNFSLAVCRAMEQKGLSIGDLAKKIDSTYEHTRKLVRGLAFPSKALRKEVSKVLSLDDCEMDKLITQDRFRSKYSNADITLGRIEGMREIEVAWPHLSDAHKEDLKALARRWSRQDKE